MPNATILAGMAAAMMFFARRATRKTLDSGEKPICSMPSCESSL